MSRTLIGRTVRRLRTERALSQQALATRLGISASYLNLIEHDQRAVTASLLIKLGETLRVDLGELSGTQERQLETGLREAFADPLLGADIVADAESKPWPPAAPMPPAPSWPSIAPGASRVRMPTASPCRPAAASCCPMRRSGISSTTTPNHFPTLEDAAGSLANELAPGAPAEMNHAIAERLRTVHGVRVTVQPLDMALRRYDPATRSLDLSESLPRESRGFHMAFQLALLEARDAVEAVLKEATPSTTEAGMLMRIGLLNYVAGALVMPYAAFHAAASGLRHDMEAIAARFGVSFEQACHRLSTLQRVGARGVPFFFLRVDPAGNVSKRFSAAGFPFARFGGFLPALGGPHGVRSAQHGSDSDRRTARRRGLPLLRQGRRPAGDALGEPRPTHVCRDGCAVANAADVVYADGLDLDRAPRRHRPVLPAVRSARLRQAELSRRWSTACRLTRRPRDRRPTGSKQNPGKAPNDPALPPPPAAFALRRWLTVRTDQNWSDQRLRRWRFGKRDLAACVVGRRRHQRFGIGT